MFRVRILLLYIVAELSIGFSIPDDQRGFTYFGVITKNDRTKLLRSDLLPKRYHSDSSVVGSVLTTESEAFLPIRVPLGCFESFNGHYSDSMYSNYWLCKGVDSGKEILVVYTNLENTEQVQKGNVVDKVNSSNILCRLVPLGGDQNNIYYVCIQLKEDRTYWIVVSKDLNEISTIKVEFPASINDNEIVQFIKGFNCILTSSKFSQKGLIMSFNTPLTLMRPDRFIENDKIYYLVLDDELKITRITIPDDSMLGNILSSSESVNVASFSKLSKKWRIFSFPSSPPNPTKFQIDPENNMDRIEVAENRGSISHTVYMPYRNNKTQSVLLVSEEIQSDSSKLRSVDVECRNHSTSTTNLFGIDPGMTISQKRMFEFENKIVFNLLLIGEGKSPQVASIRCKFGNVEISTTTISEFQAGDVIGLAYNLVKKSEEEIYYYGRDESAKIDFEKAKNLPRTTSEHITTLHLTEHYNSQFNFKFDAIDPKEIEINKRAFPLNVSCALDTQIAQISSSLLRGNNLHLKSAKGEYDHIEYLELPGLADIRIFNNNWGYKISDNTLYIFRCDLMSNDQACYTVTSQLLPPSLSSYKLIAERSVFSGIYFVFEKATSDLIAVYFDYSSLTIKINESQNIIGTSTDKVRRIQALGSGLLIVEIQDNDINTIHYNDQEKPKCSKIRWVSERLERLRSNMKCKNKDIISMMEIDPNNKEAIYFLLLECEEYHILIRVESDRSAKESWFKKSAFSSIMLTPFGLLTANYQTLKIEIIRLFYGDVFNFEISSLGIESVESIVYFDLGYTPFAIVAGKLNGVLRSFILDLHTIDSQAMILNSFSETFENSEIRIVISDYSIILQIPGKEVFYFSKDEIIFKLKTSNHILDSDSVFFLQKSNNEVDSSIGINFQKIQNKIGVSISQAPPISKKGKIILENYIKTEGRVSNLRISLADPSKSSKISITNRTSLISSISTYSFYSSQISVKKRFLDGTIFLLKSDVSITKIYGLRSGKIDLLHSLNARCYHFDGVNNGDIYSLALACDRNMLLLFKKNANTIVLQEEIDNAGRSYYVASSLVDGKRLYVAGIDNHNVMELWTYSSYNYLLSPQFIFSKNNLNSINSFLTTREFSIFL